MKSDSLTVIGIDPSFTATGIAIVKERQPFDVYTVKMENLKSDKPGQQLVMRLSRLIQTLARIIEVESCDALIVERTDWMRRLDGDVNWKKQYAIERKNQESLALLQGALAAFALHKHIPFYLVGVNEWHMAFGAGNKEAVMMLLAQEFPMHISRKFDEYYFDRDGHKMNNNETDALGIALVGYDIVMQERRVMEAA